MKKDMTPVIGIVLGLALVIWSITSAGDIMGFIDVPSIVITFFGSFAALMVNYPLSELKKIPKLLKVLLEGPSIDRIETLNLFLDMSKKARMEGILALEEEIKDIDNETISQGVQMVVDGMEPDAIREILELKLGSTARRHQKGQDIFSSWGELAPGFGMLGTLIGLVIMLLDMDDPSAIGTGMATALLTTFYGSLLANLFFIPISNNLSNKTDEEMFIGDMIVEGVLEIQSGSNTRLLEDKLKNYLSPDEQERYMDSQTNVSEDR